MKLYSTVNIFVGIWGLSVLTIFYFSFSYLPYTSVFPHEFLKNLANWDGGHYLGIAKNDYNLDQFVFFPLYPILINLISRITGDFLSAGLLISFVSIILAANLFYRLIIMDFGNKYAQKSLLALLLFPLSFHFLTVYTESLFLLLTVATFLFARRKKYLLATICAALASATRITGLATVLSLILPLYLTEGINRKNWMVMLSPLGLVIYCFYLYMMTGDPFYFIKAESTFWQGGLVLPGSALLFSFKQLFVDFSSVLDNFRNFLDLSFSLFGILVVWQVFRKLSLDYIIFSVVALILPMFSPTIVAMPRYLLTIFPIFIVLSFFKNQYLIFFYQLISGMLLAIYAFLFIGGYWVS